MDNIKQGQNPLESKVTCGIVMPISPLDGCSTEHWLEVQDIIKSVIHEGGFQSNLVSDGDEIGVIQGRIIQNLYNYPIVICDVSGKNPNVMFELGIRLAFDKATIIIKDDKTDYSFDTSPIEHLAYPRDLRFNKILSFKEKLYTKLLATYKKGFEDPSYSPFLKHFGEFVVPKLEQKEVGFNDFVISSLNDIKNEISKIKKSNKQKQRVDKDDEITSIKLESPKEKDEFMLHYLNRIANGDTLKSIDDLKATTFSYLKNWKELGYTEEELLEYFNKNVSRIEKP